MARSSLGVYSPSSLGSNSKKALLEVADTLRSSTMHYAGSIVAAWISAVDTARSACDSLLGVYSPNDNPARAYRKRNSGLSGFRERIRKITPARAVESVFSSLSAAVVFTASLLAVTATIALIGAYVVVYSAVMACTNVAYTASVAFGSGGSNVAILAVKDLKGLSQKMGSRVGSRSSGERAVKEEPVYVNVNELGLEPNSGGRLGVDRFKAFCKSVAMGLVALLAFSVVFAAVAVGASAVVVMSPLFLVAASICEAVCRYRAVKVGALCANGDAKLLGAAVETGALENSTVGHKEDQRNPDEEKCHTQNATHKYLCGSASTTDERYTDSVGGGNIPGWNTPFWPGEEGDQQREVFSAAVGPGFCESGDVQSVFGQTNYRHVHERGWDSYGSSGVVGALLHDVTAEGHRTARVARNVAGNS